MIVGKKCEEATLWDEIVHDLDGHPLQLWGWGELKSAHNWQAHRVIFTDNNNQVVGAAQILVRHLPPPFRRLCYVPRGPVWANGHKTEILEALVVHVKHHLPGVVLTIEPDVEKFPEVKGWRKSQNTILIPKTLILDLTLPQEELYQQISKSIRYYIRKSEREGITVKRVIGKSELAKILTIYQETAKRAQFALHNDQYYYDLADMLGDSSVVFAAYKEDEPLAFVWLAISNKTAFELYGGINALGQELRVNNILKWHAIKTCQKWGIERYDMNGLLNDGISAFKRGFANHENMLAGTYDYPLSPLYAIWSKGLPTAKKAVRHAKKILKR